MASKVTSGKLNISVSETVTVNGVEHSYTNSRSVTGINNVAHRIMRIPSDASVTTTTVLLFDDTPAAAGPPVAPAVSAGTFIPGHVKYIRLTNLDDTNHVVLALINTGSDTAYVKLGAGETLILNNLKIEASDNATALTDTDAADSTLVLASEVDKITAQASGGAVDIEYFVASVQP